MRNHPSLDTKPGAHDRSRTGWVRPWCMVVLVASMATGCASRQEPPAAAVWADLHRRGRRIRVCWEIDVPAWKERLERALR